MNVSIATVAKDVGHHRDGDSAGHHPLHARHGCVHDHRRQGRPDPRAQARLHDRLRHLRLRLVHHGARRLAAGAHHRLVLPRGPRRGADHARGRRARGDELRRGRNAPGPTGSWRRPAPSPSPSGRSSAGCARPISAGAWSSSGEVVIVLCILALSRRMADCPGRTRRPARPGRAPSCRRPALACSSSASSARARGDSSSPSPTRRRGSGPRRSCG